MNTVKPRTAMKTRSTLILLSLAALTALAGETQSPVKPDDDLTVILQVAREHRPEGAATVQVERVAGMDLAYVRYSVRRDGLDVVTAVLTLKKTSKGWEVESCAL